MLSQTALLALLPSALGAALSPRPMNMLEVRAPSATCNGNMAPNYDDCRTALEANFDCSDAGRLLDQPGAPNNILYWNSGNCRILATWFDPNYRISVGQVCNGVNAIQQLCKNLDAGGTQSQNPESYQIGLVNNDEFDPEKVKRADGDTSFDVSVQLNGVLQDDMRQEITRGTSGTSISITKEQTVENSLTVSASVTAGLAGIVEISTGIDTTQTYSSSSSFGVDVPINCNPGQTGVIFFIPAFNIWRGAFRPSGDFGEIKQPATNPDGRTTGEYRVECQG